MSLTLPSVSPPEACLQNAMAGVAENFVVTFGGEQKKVTLLSDQLSLQSVELTLSLLVDGHPFVISFNKAPFSNKLSEELGVVSFSDLPGPVKQSVVERVLETDLSKLENWIGRTVALGTDEPCGKLPFRIPFRMEGDEVFFGELATDGDAVSLLNKILDALPRKKINAGAVPVSLGIEVGRTLLDIEAVRDLESGDVIIVENGPDLKNYQIEIRPSHSRIYKARLRGSEIKIESFMSVDPDYISEYDNVAEAETGNLPAKRDALTSIGDIPVNVVFELGRRQITVDDLDQLQPGALLELESPVDEAKIVVRVNGKAIATGSLVEVGEKIAVRID